MVEIEGSRCVYTRSDTRNKKMDKIMLWGQDELVFLMMDGSISPFYEMLVERDWESGTEEADT